MLRTALTVLPRASSCWGGNILSQIIPTSRPFELCSSAFWVSPFPSTPQCCRQPGTFDLGCFWATICKTVHPMLSVRCLSCRVCDVRAQWPNSWTDQDEAWHALQVGLGPGHIVLDGDPAPPPPKGHSPHQFSAHTCCGQMAAWIKMPLGMEVGLSPGDIVLDWDPVLPPKKGAEPPPKFSPHFYVAKRLDASVKMPLNWYGGRPQPRGLCVRWETSSPPPKGAEPPNFQPMFIVAKQLDGSTWHLAWR